jgi:hypothetical protein
MTQLVEMERRKSEEMLDKRARRALGGWGMSLVSESRQPERVGGGPSYYDHYCGKLARHPPKRKGSTKQCIHKADYRFEQEKEYL